MVQYNPGKVRLTQLWQFIAARGNLDLLEALGKSVVSVFCVGCRRGARHLYHTCRASAHQQDAVHNLSD